MVNGADRRVLLQIPSERIEQAVYAPSGHLIFLRRSSLGGIWAVSFSLSSLQIEGEPFLLDPEGASPSVAADGTLLYAHGEGRLNGQLVLVDMEGTLVKNVGEPQVGIINPEISWDGTRVAASSVEGETLNLWVHDIEHGTAAKLTFGSTPVWCAEWDPSNNRIFYCTDQGIFSIAADGTGEPELFIEKGERPSLQPGVPWIGYSVRDPATKYDLFYRSVEDASDPVPFVVAEENQFDIEIAPGGRYALYASTESGEEEIYNKMLPGGEGKWKVTVGGGFWPRWGPRGDRLYYLVEGRGGVSLMKVDVTTTPSLKLSRPEKLFGEDTIRELRLGGGDRQYDVHPNVEQILVIFAEERERSTKTRLVLTQNWIETFGKGAQP